MEKNYKSEEFDNLMDKYNFDSPIEVTLIIEDEDPPEPVRSHSRELLVINNTNGSNTYVSPNVSYFSKRTDSYVMPTVNKKYNIKSIVEENNHSMSVIETVFPEAQEKTQDIQWQLLDSVAVNLIRITKYYFYNFDNINLQTENYERLKFKYVTFKHNIFHLSYNTTIAILLPLENDKLFINDFIHRVITIANRISWFQISFERLDLLIRELLIWTKQEKSKLDKKLGLHNHEKSMDWSSSALTISNKLNRSRQVLNMPFDNSPTTNHTTHFNLKTHLQGQEMNISPNIRHLTNYSAEKVTELNISPRINYPMQDSFKQTIIGPIKNNAIPEATKKWHNNCSETFHSQPEINISPNFIQRTSHSNQKTSNPLNIDSGIYNSAQGVSHLPFNDATIKHSKKTMTAKYKNEPKTNNFSNCQTTNTNTNKILLSTGPPNQEITISVDTKILANINHQNTNQLNSNTIECYVNEAHGPKSMKRRKPQENSYYPYRNLNRVPHHNDNNLNNKKNNSSATTFKSPVDGLCHEDSRKAEYELFNADTLRSSISRDSGFGSPIYGSFRNEQTIETGEEQETPFISNVISMNPNAIHLNIGFCKFCGATTINMCIGCYREYYCSFSCQTKDWENHKYVCSELVLS